MRSLTLCKVTLVLATALAGCGPGGGGGNTCAPACAVGTSCDPVSLACVPDNVAGDGGAVDLAVAGGCNPKCSGLTPLCNPAKKCVACLADSDCPMNTFCKVISDSVASCVAGCNDDKRCGGGKCCGNRCVDTTSDATNCGACGTVCSGAHAKAACTAGKCVPGKCDSGWGDCNGNGADGCETNLHIDAKNCTACGNVCKIANAITACADGCYAAACQWGFDDCNQDPMDGCETSVLMDGLNCGACAKSCAKLPNAAAGCMNGSCVLGACNMGFFDCNRDAADGCESSLLGDPKNCGKCGVTCPNNLPFCSGGQCGLTPPCKNMGGGALVRDNGAKEKIDYCYEGNDTVEIRAKKACESHFGIGKCCVIMGGYQSMQYGECGKSGEQGTLHWHWDNQPNGHCAPMYVVGDVVSPGWCGVVLGNFTK